MAHNYGFNVEKGTSAVSLGSSTAKWKVNGFVAELIELTIDLQSTDGETLTINDSRITPYHEVLQSVIVEPVGRLG